ncbi:hypothetical protein HO133_009388 [Letharia lupina]|uniref:Uncharacterized protein n=1 Tax=Letharia lupina TaxID=560253 RepID=A0A8H6FFF7_9LECA|nr:uncharacterized protein HO133_009388 [Letharia lupina]KAF6226522.1 hypothetical protein HO133_009388 [Letharia lupina]
MAHYACFAVNEQWSLQAPLPSFWIKQGNLELFFRSVGGPIPWSVVARFATKMLCATQLGWLGTYEIIYQNGAANQAVGVTLRIANNQLPSPQHHLTKSRTVEAAEKTDLKKRNQIQLISFKVHDFVSAAQKYSSYADHLWVNTFDAFYEEAEFGITVALSLRLLQRSTGPRLTAITLPPRRSLQRPSPPLRPRAPTMPPSPAIRVTSFIRTAALVPTALAAAQLEDFYTIIATKIETGQLAHRRPARTVVCSLWDFELVFSCDRIDVPWSFVQAFAIDMAEWSSRQFTGLYEATVRGEGPLSGLVFVVQMRLKGKGRRSPYLV